MELQLNILQNLKCAKCDLYLSYAPIYINLNGDNICGRCEYAINEDEIKIRNTSFETVATFLKFPCQYKKNGCNQMLKFTTVINHENNCIFHPYQCPVDRSGLCEWTGCSYDFIKHCEDFHENSLLNTQPFNIEFNLTEDIEKNFLMKAYNFLFLLQMKSNSTLGKLWFCIRYLGNENYLTQFYCTFKISRYSTILTDMLKILPNAKQNDMLETEAYVCDIFGLETVLKGTENVTVSFYINKNLDFDLLEEVTCKLCHVYAKPPIYSVEDNTVCFSCAPNESIENLDLTLKGLALMYPCAHRNKGCTYFNSLKDLWKHEIFFCTFFNCCVCKTLLNESIEIHFNSKHSSLIYLLEEILAIELNMGLYWMLIRYGQMLFICRYTFQNSVLNFYVCSNLTSDKINQYSCDMKIIDFKTKKTHIKQMQPIADHAFDWKLSMNLTDIPVDIENKKLNIQFEFYRNVDSNC